MMNVMYDVRNCMLYFILICIILTHEIKNDDVRHWIQDEILRKANVRQDDECNL